MEDRYCLIGASISSIENINNTDNVTENKLGLIFLIIGIVVTIFGIVFFTTIARRELRRYVEQEEERCKNENNRNKSFSVSKSDTGILRTVSLPAFLSVQNDGTH